MVVRRTGCTSAEGEAACRAIVQRADALRGGWRAIERLHRCLPRLRCIQDDRWESRVRGSRHTAWATATKCFYMGGVRPGNGEPTARPATLPFRSDEPLPDISALPGSDARHDKVLLATLELRLPLGSRLALLLLLPEARSPTADFNENAANHECAKNVGRSCAPHTHTHTSSTQVMQPSIS